MAFRSRKAAILAGILVIVIAWAIKVPALFHWASIGLISLMSFLLLCCAALSILVGALRVWLGKRGLVPFTLYVVFAVLACISSHFLFAVPLAIGIFVAITAMVWPASGQQTTQADGTSHGVGSV